MKIILAIITFILASSLVTIAQPQVVIKSDGNNLTIDTSHTILGIIAPLYKVDATTIGLKTDNTLVVNNGILGVVPTTTTGIKYIRIIVSTGQITFTVPIDIINYMVFRNGVKLLQPQIDYTVNGLIMTIPDMQAGYLLLVNTK